MKRKVLISIVGVALFAVAIGFGLNNTQEDNLKVKNIEALASGNNDVIGSNGITCRCQWFGGECKASGWGQICAPAQATHCTSYSDNC